MTTSEHNNDCFCGQPMDLVATSASMSCRRCGRIAARSSRDQVASSRVGTATPVLALGRAA
jgi:hypothetical protein